MPYATSAAKQSLRTFWRSGIPGEFRLVLINEYFHSTATRFFLKNQYYSPYHPRSSVSHSRHLTNFLNVERSKMTGRGGGGGGRKTLLAPIHFIFSLLQQRKTVSIWLYEQLTIRIEGKVRVRRTSLLFHSDTHDARDLTNL